MAVRYFGPLCATITSLLLSTIALAQEPQQPPSKTYTGNVGGGFALTGGNTDTKNYNLTGEFTRDPKRKNVIKGKASYLRGSQNDVLNVHRTNVNLRDEYNLTSRIYVFGQLDYVKDEFKQIIFLWVPSGGLGYRLINTSSTQLTLDVAAGGLIEKNPGLDSRKSGSLVPGERFEHKLSPTTTFTQSLSTIFKTKDWDDSLTNFSAALATTLVGNLQLKLEFTDSYKNRPTNSALKKNDTAFITAFVMKF